VLGLGFVVSRRTRRRKRAGVTPVVANANAKEGGLP